MHFQKCVKLWKKRNSMKQKDIKKQLKYEAKQFMPNPLNKIKKAAQEDHLLPLKENKQKNNF